MSGSNRKRTGSVAKCVFITDDRHKQLCDWVKRDYRDRLSAEDLADVNLIDEVDVAIKQLDEILGC